MAELRTRRVEPARERMLAAIESGAPGAEEVALKAADELDLGERSTVAEVAAALAWSHYRARRQVDAASALTGDLVATFEAVASGRLEPVKAETIVRVLADLPERDPSSGTEPVDPVAVRARVESEVLPYAAFMNLPELAEALKEAVLRAVPEAANDSAQRARARRRVRLIPEADDMMRLEALMSVEDGMRVGSALQLVHDAARAAGDDRTHDQSVLDTFVDVIVAAAGSAPAASGSGDQEPKPSRRRRSIVRTEVNVTVPVETLTGEAEEPGWLDRYGPITAETARRLAQGVAENGYWRCIVTDGVHGTLLGMGKATFTKSYQAPEGLKRYMTARHRTCSFPGCRRPASGCDFDHLVPFAAGGATCECNGNPACANHHRLKSETGWEAAASTDPGAPAGAIEWTSPTGHAYEHSPPALRGSSHRKGRPGQGGVGPADASRVVDPWVYDPSLAELPVDEADPPF